MSRAFFKTKAVILADEIRKEDNGKAIIIGVYSGDILFPRFPAQKMFGVWLEVEFGPVKRPSHKMLDFRIKITGEAQPFEALHSVGIEIPAGDEPTKLDNASVKSILIVNGMPAAISAPGTLELSIREPGKRWKKILVKSIAHQVVSSVVG